MSERKEDSATADLPQTAVKESRGNSCMDFRRFPLLRSGCAALGVCAMFWLLVAACSLGTPEAAGQSTKTGENTAKTDEEYRRLVIGTWEDHYSGKRTMTIRTNGTAIMIVELTGLKAMLSAPRLEFDMVWSIENGRLKKRTTGGRPSGKVNAILKMMGDRVDEPILELTQERLLLQDENGKRSYDFKRVSPIK